MACQEVPRAREGIAALDDYLDLLTALLAYGPHDVREANDIPALIRGAKVFRTQLAAKTA